MGCDSSQYRSDQWLLIMHNDDMKDYVLYLTDDLSKCQAYAEEHLGDRTKPGFATFACGTGCVKRSENYVVCETEVAV